MTTENESKNGSSVSRGLRTLLGYAPAALVLAAIAGVGVWGHKTGWTAPRFADLAGQSQTRETEDWCAEHGVPEPKCIKCHPELAGGNAADWCPEHGVPESKCTICHPEILTTGVAGDWCVEHDLPESSCTLCHPEIAVRGEAPVGSEAATVTLASAPGEAISGEDGRDQADGSVAEAESVGDHSARNPQTCQTHALRVQFASADSMRKAGVEVAAVGKRPMADAVWFNGKVEYDRRHMAAISSPVAGRVWRVIKSLGEEVKAGEVLALIESPEVGAAKGDLLQAIAEVELAEQTVARLKASSEAGFRTKADLQEAEAAAKAAGIRRFAAQQRLANLGLPEGSASVVGDATRGNVLPLVAPLDGIVIAQEGVAGEAIDALAPLLTVADVSKMWVRIDMPLSAADAVSIGQQATFAPDGDQTHSVEGQITWIDTAVSEQTRTLRARAEVQNPDGTLKAGTFGQVRITTRRDEEATVVPTDALQWEGCCNIVFVRQADTIFQARKVKLGARTDHFAEVLNGVLPGEVVASAGSNVLKAEILKSNLGAGCADH